MLVGKDLSAKGPREHPENVSGPCRGSGTLHGKPLAAVPCPSRLPEPRGCLSPPPPSKGEGRGSRSPSACPYSWTPPTPGGCHTETPAMGNRPGRGSDGDRAARARSCVSVASDSLLARGQRGRSTAERRDSEGNWHRRTQRSQHLVTAPGRGEHRGSHRPGRGSTACRAAAGHGAWRESEGTRSSSASAAGSPAAPHSASPDRNNIPAHASRICRPTPAPRGLQHILQLGPGPFLQAVLGLPSVRPPGSPGTVHLQPAHPRCSVDAPAQDTAGPPPTRPSSRPGSSHSSTGLR